MFNRSNAVVMLIVLISGLLFGVAVMRSSSHPMNVQPQGTVLTHTETGNLTHAESAPLAQMQSRLIAPLNITALTNGADLIAVGQVTGVEDKGVINTTEYGNPAQARRLVVSLRIERILKEALDGSGGNSGVFNFEALLPTSSGIATKTFGVFFLRRTSTQNYSVVDPDHPYIMAVARTPDVINSDALERVVAEVVQVIQSPDVSLSERKQSLSALEGVKTMTATVALRRVAREGNSELRVRAMTVLLGNGDTSVLETAVNTLLNPPSNTPSYELQNLAYVVREIKEPEAVTALARLLRAQDTELRRSAAAALRQIGNAAVIEPLSKALDDSDQMVRYNAVMGLAEATGETDGAPSVELFQRDEKRYMTYWRERMKRR